MYGGQNVTKKICIEGHTKQKYDKKKDNAEAVESASYWMPTQSVINIAEFWGWAKSYTHLIKVGHLEDSQ